MRLSTETREARRDWFDQARKYLVKFFRGLDPRREQPPIWEGKQITTMNEVYTIVLGINENAGKSLARRGKTVPTHAQIAAIRKFMPEIDDRIADMNTKPASIELELCKKEYEKAVAERDRLIEEYEAKVSDQARQIASLIAIIENMQKNS